ncbi:MAG: hypothetical protein J6S05_07495 [Bacteroidaceae bacterium]|nr:hypothetical protein [Bacteroidaceae bacterium]
MGGSIALKDNETGQFHNYPIAWLDIDRLQTLDPSLPLSQQTTDCAGAVQYATATYGASVDLDYYTIGSAATPYTSGYIGPCISDTIKPADTASARLVDFVKPDGTPAPIGTKFTDLFHTSTYSIPPADWNTSSAYYTKQSIAGYTKYNSAVATFDPANSYSKNTHLSRFFTTTTGNTFGLCIGIGGSDNREFIVSGCRYVDASAARYGADILKSPAAQDNRGLFGDGGWMRFTNAGGGSTVPSANSNAYNNSENNPYSAQGGTLAEPVILREVSAQIVAAKINGKDYLGIACLRWNGDTVSAIYVELFPAWFWGEFSATEGTPDSAPQFYGIDAGINGGYGEYTDTQEDPPIPAAVQPFANSSPDGYGLHVYRIDNAQYEAVQAALWGSGGVASSLWNKWVNYKFNPIASIIACHYLPSSLLPVITPPNLQQLRAGGCAIVNSGVEYLNSKTTVTETFAARDIPRFFSNHLAYTPYSHYQLFLPFCGWIEIPADRLRGGAIEVVYRCDIITGNVCAFVNCMDADGRVTQYTATGNAALSVPVTGNDNGTGAAVGAISGLALGLLTGNAAGIAAGAAGAALSVSGAQHTTQQAGQYGGSIAAMGQLNILLVCTQPIQQDTERARDLRGLVTYVDATIEDLAGTGYTECAEVRADGIGTDAEKARIEEILKGGVYL